MRKLIIALLMIAVLAVPTFAIGWEVGMHATVAPSGDAEQSIDPIIGFHVGISPWAILYASWDALALPPNMIQGMTGYTDESGRWIQGFYRPGFLNMFDVGFRFLLGPVAIFTTVGTNNIYVYRQSELDGAGGSWGANLRLGAGLKFGFWGVSATGTVIFPSFPFMIETFRMLGSTEDGNRQWALDQIVNGLVPSLMATLYF